MKMKFIMWTCILALAAAAGAWAQGSATANLEGTIRDAHEGVIASATVTVRDDARGIERTTMSDEQGEYKFLALPPGAYTLTATAQGFTKRVVTNLKLTIGQVASYPLTLQVSGVASEVSVSSQPLLVETSQTWNSTTIGQQPIESLPINGRNYINFTLTNSQVAPDSAPSIGVAPTSGLNFGGQRARSNLVNVDGMDAVDNSTNGIRSTVPQDAVQEFQLLTNGFEAEYGRASGGVVNIITKSGTNDFHGDMFGYLRNRNFQATNPFSTVPDPAYTRVQAGADAGGALIKNRTYVYGSFEITRRQETGFSTIGTNNFGLVPLPAAFGPVPAGSLVTPDQATFLATAPVNLATAGYAQLAAGGSGVALAGTPGAPGPLGAFPTTSAPLPASFHNLMSQMGNFPISEHTDIYSIRLDHKLNESNKLMFRFGASPSDVTGIEVNGQNQTYGQNSFSRTSLQHYNDYSATVQDSWVIGSNKVNEFGYQYSRRRLEYDNSRAPGGGDVAINIIGYAYFGREPFSYVHRTEQRHQINDKFSWTTGHHTFKFGGDFNLIPISADFTINFGGLYNFSSVSGTQISPFFSGMPDFSPVQAYGLGLPQVMVQGVGNSLDAFHQTTIGFFAQDSWRLRPNLTLNYGVRYDYEFTPQFPASNAMSQAAQDALNITQGIPRDKNNVAPRVGLSWDPQNNGKTVIRASYGIFFDHPLLGLAFDSDVADGSQAPQVVLFGGAPCNPAEAPSPLNALNLNATNAFQGLLGVGNCLPAGMATGLQYMAAQQRFDPTPQTNGTSLFVNQNYLTAGVPLIMQPFGFPVAKDFQYAYAEQTGLSIERDLGHEMALSVAYNYTGGHHINRPINVNATNPKALIENWERANAYDVANSLPTSSNPLLLSSGTPPCGVGPAGPFVQPALLSFFRPSGLNPSLSTLLAPCLPIASAIASMYNLGLGVPVPFSDMVANQSTGNSAYNALTVNWRKRMQNHFEFLVSYTWAHTIDDSTDLTSLLEPQNNYNPNAERSNSTFDQRHRFVLSGVYDSGKAGSDFWGKFFSDWTVAPIIEVDSGRPYNILSGGDYNFDFSSSTDRPNVVPSSATTNACGYPVVASKASPSGYFQAPCFVDSNPLDGSFTGSLSGNLGRNAGTLPYTMHVDLRIARTFHLNERLKIQGSADAFNLFNKFNVADVNPLYTSAGTPTAALDPRQIQFALRLNW
jgi:outer membrane receptor protein involved in Fe transport